MGSKLFFLLLFSFGILAAFSSHAEETLLVQVPAVYDEHVLIGEKIKEECKVDNLVGNHVFGRVNEKFPASQQIQDLGKAGKDKVLKLTILSAIGWGGGGWSGGKSITLRADLIQNGQVIRSLVKQRESRGGVFGGFKSTCGILERDAQALAKDVTNWLMRPAAVTSNSVANLSSEPSAVKKEAESE